MSQAFQRHPSVTIPRKGSRASPPGLSCRSFLLYMPVLGTLPFHPSAIAFSALHRTSGLFLAYSIHHFLIWSYLRISPSPTIPTWKFILAGWPALLAKIHLPYLGGSCPFEALVSPERRFHGRRNQNAVANSSCAIKCRSAGSAQPSSNHPSPRH